MKRNYLSKYFDGVAIKKLSMVEADPGTSNQHEFNGVANLRSILGEPQGKIRYNALFLYFGDHDDEYITDEGFLTWYDARQKARIEKSVMRWEYRLYFNANRVTRLFNEGDLFVLAKRPGSDTLLAIVARADTTIAGQIAWLFGFSDLADSKLLARSQLETEHDRIRLASSRILDSIGINVEFEATEHLEKLLHQFGNRFPDTKTFSAYARSTLPEVSALDDCDAAFSAWTEREEMLFRALEKHIISERLSQGFDDDVEGFIDFSLSVQNRRKSRAGLALEHHLETILQEYKIRHARSPVTENRARPDFIFPGASEYHNPAFNACQLTMLGVKSSCKDRWRQVLSEANRIEKKHLLTLEAPISKTQTDEMQARQLQLVLPAELHQAFPADQQASLMSLAEFIHHVLAKQQQ